MRTPADITHTPVASLGVDGDQRVKRVLALTAAFLVVWLPLTLVAVVAVIRNQPIPSWDSWLLFLGFWAILLTGIIRFLLRRRAGHQRSI